MATPIATPMLLQTVQLDIEVFEAAAAVSSSTWRGIMNSCAKICNKFKGVVDCDSLLILHRSKWRCLVRTYSAVIDSLTKQVEEASSHSNQETLCQKLLVSLNVLHHAVREGVRCFEDCICKISEINHSWLIGKALKVSMSSDIVDIHLHDFIWAYATVKVQALWLGIHFNCMELPDLVEETSNLCRIWAAEDAKGDLCASQEQLLTNFMGKEEEETLRLAKFIVDKLTHTIEDKVDAEADHVPPDFLWVDPQNVKRNPDSCIGRGSYGVVYEAMWLRGRFAVKDIFYAGEDGREQAIQARLHHPNVINLVCCTKNPSLEILSLVMELMHKDLRLLMKGRKQDGMDPPFTLLEAIDLMLQVSKGMEYLHSLNIMHRDLKSSNILVSLPPISNQQIRHHTHLKIADFGNAKAKELSTYFTTKPTGTLVWRAPEVFRDQGSDAHARYRKTADVYSFGLVCYEILTGELPFKETQHLYERVMGGERPKLPNYCPRALASYIERCWDGNANARPSFTCICRMLRYFKACILLENSHDAPNAAQNWLAHPVSSRACARITDMGQSQGSSISALPGPLNILLEMHWCRIALQESNEDPEISRPEDISEYTYNPSSSVENGVEQVNGPSLGRSVENGVEQVNGPRIVLQESNEDPGRSGWSITRLFNKFSRNFKVCMRPTTAQDEYPILQPEVKKMTLKELRAATDNFNERNKLGEGGFGPVYKGILTSGRVVAVKMLALNSNQGDMLVLNSNFRSELELINAVRHRNLIQLLGYCAEDSKRLLVYEFLRLGSLDRFLLDRKDASCEALYWAVRVNIIKGVAKGLCYLHEDSPVKIVHRDIKACNILLDENMNPKITDFGLATLFDPTSMPDYVVGTVGYLAPEYFITGEFTEKADIYSFSILVLEMVSGRRVGSFGDREFLLKRAWSLFENEEEMQLLDQRIANTHEVKVHEVKKVVHLALLCTQIEADERPSMSQVCTMLSNEAGNMPLPSKPSSLLSMSTNIQP